MPTQKRILSVALGSLMISAASLPLAAADSGWDCRVSADGSSWDCYRDGALVIQPMPSSATQDKPVQAIDSTSAVEVPQASPQTETPAVSDSASSSRTANSSIEIKAASEPAAASVEALPATASQPETVDSTANQINAQPEKVTDDETASRSFSRPVTAPTTMPEPREIPAQTPPASSIAEESPDNDDQTASLPTESAGKDETHDEAPNDSVAAETSAGPSPDSAADMGEPATEVATKISANSQPLYCRTQPRQHIQRQSQPDSETRIDADDAQLDDNSGIASFSGDVQLQKGDQQVRADNMEYNSNTADVNASGNLGYQRPDLVLQGDSARINLDSEQGQVEQAVYHLPASDARGKAAQMQLLGDGKTAYQDISYTTCAEGNNDWIFNAAQLEIDQNTGVGIAHDMQLYFKDVPILYLPYASFPIDDRRKSGFLIPSIGTSEINGADISVPYYLNLAPNYDATLTPRIMSERGVLLGGEFRYLDKSNESIFSGEILPNDSLYSGRDPRGAASFKHSTSFSDRLSGNLNLNYVSDRHYLEDLGSSLAVTSTQYLQRSAALNYHGNDFSISSRLLQYQPVDSTITAANEPYRLLPQITLNGSRQIAGTDFTAELLAQYTNFDHDTRVEGSRIDVKPSISYEWLRSWGFVIPKLSVRYTNYELNNQTPGQPTNIDRTTETFSLDSGLFFERDTSWFGQAAIQTLEPRAFYLYTPEENQSNIPLFDTGLYSFSLASLFRDNRFSGADRVGDANQLTLAVTTRFISQRNSREWLSASLGQIFYFEDRSVQLSGSTPTTKDTSAYIAAVSSNPMPHWSAQAGIQWDPDLADEIQKSSARIKFEDNDRHLFSARYQQDRPANLEYVNASAYWPVAFNTRLVGHVNYSIEDDRYVESVAGIEHGSSCCWRFRALVRDYQVNVQADSNLTFLLQLELSGFARLGDDIDTFLENTIEGFVRDE